MNKIGLLMFLIIVILFISGCTGFKGEKEITIGIIEWNSDNEYEKNIQGFKDGLAEKGFIEGKNVVYIKEISYANKDKHLEISKRFVNEENVDLIYSLTTPATLIVKSVTTEIPIVFSIVTYPVEAGVINSLRNSGNNLVGTRNYISVARQYYQFERIFAGTKTLAFVHRKDEPNSKIQYNEFKELLEARQIKIIDIAAVDLKDMETQIEDNIEMIDSLYSACDTLIQAGGEEVVINLSKKYKKPHFACLEGGVQKGALMGNVADFYSIGKMSGEKAAEILNGAQPSWLITESPRTDYIIINMKTAKELGITIKQEILDDATEVIE